jgi:hypothetical protein
MQILLRTALFYAGAYFETFIGVLGPLSIHIPFCVVLLYGGLLAWISITYPGCFTLSMRQRLIIVTILLASALSTSVAIWMVITPVEELHSADSNALLLIEGIQGRYLIPLALLLMMLAGIQKFNVRSRLTPILLLCVATVANASALYTVWKTYYVPPPVHQFTAVKELEGKLVRRPGVTPDDMRVFLVKNGIRHWILRGSWIQEHGYRWPDDVRVVDPGLLAAMPEGEPMK